MRKYKSKLTVKKSVANLPSDKGLNDFGGRVKIFPPRKPLVVDPNEVKNLRRSNKVSLPKLDCDNGAGDFVRTSKFQ